MKVKTHDLTGAALDYAVAICNWPELVWGDTIGLSAHARGLIVIPERKEPDCYWSPSTNWSQGGPLVQQGLLMVSPNPGSGWRCQAFLDTNIYEGISLLVAAMRCYVGQTIGGEIDIPNELIKENNP